jgi:hypothetical protein
MGELAFGYFSLLIKVKVTRHQATSIKMGRRRPSLKPNFQLITTKRCGIIQQLDSSGFFVRARINVFVT